MTDNHLSTTKISLTYPALWRRFAAMVYDLLLVIAVSMAYAGIWIGLEKVLLGHERFETNNVFFQLGWLLVIVGFFCYFWKKGGQTLGMRAWRLQVVTVEEAIDSLNNTKNNPNLKQCVIRLALAPVSYLCFVISWVRDDRQCLHDLLSHTQVILLPKEKKR